MVLVENKEKLKGNAWSKESKQRDAGMIRKYWDNIRAVLKGRFVKKKIIMYIFFSDAS